MLIGVADDIWDLDWMTKLAGQFLAAGLIAWQGGVQIYSLPIGGLTVGSGWMSIFITVFAIVLVMNAINFIDGLDGLVAGVALIANGIFFVYSYLLVRDTRPTQLLQPRLPHRRGPGRRLRRLPAAELAPGEDCSWATPARCWSAC